MEREYVGIVDVQQDAEIPICNGMRGGVWEMQMQACAMRMLLAVYTNVRRRHANKSGVAQNIPLSAVVEIDRNPAKKTERPLTVGVPPRQSKSPLVQQMSLIGRAM
jgi:hypothetical protein